MATAARVGRSREELNAAAAALTAAMHDVDDAGSAAVLAERARQFEDEAMDAPPISAVGEVTDDQLLGVLGSGIAAGVTFLLASAHSPAGPVPEEISTGVSMSIRDRAMGNTLLRHELLEGARNILADRCVCGCERGHEDGDGS